jgi:hypothetical protein
LVYYLAATWPIVPGASAFFLERHSTPLALLLWFALAVLGAAPWLLLYNRRWMEFSALLSLVTLALPPWSLVTVAHPWTAAGIWFPGTNWIGLLLPTTILLARRWVGLPYALLLLTVVSGIEHFEYSKPQPNPAIIAIHTRFGGAPFASNRDSVSLQQEISIRETALGHPGAIVLFPETAIPSWSRQKDAYWSEFFRQLEQQGTSLLLGTTVPIPNTRSANRNILLSRGAGPHFAYVQRVPVPLGMWQIRGGGRDGFPLMLDYPPTIRVRDHRAAVLICYEQLVAWTALQSLARNPDFILAASNIHWAGDAVVPAIQHQAVQSWAALWGITAYEATNR